MCIRDSQSEVFKVPISEVVQYISGQSWIKYLILDGIITQRLFDAAKSANVECIVGHRVAKLSQNDGVLLKTFRDLGIA